MRMETKAEQFYPTYKAKERDVLLLEFEEAQKIANGQSKVYGQVTNILLAIATFAFTIILKPADSDNEILKAQNLILSNSIIFCLIITVFGAILLRYFVDLQKQITINARKVITLRTLLGLDYGHIHLTLPNWRVEGATDPFVIRYFNGWLDFRTMPFWVITILVNTIWFLTAKNNFPITIDWYYVNIVVTAFYFVIFRKSLNDRHETMYLDFVKFFIHICRIKLKDNFESVIYRAKLAYVELDRLQVNYKILISVLVDIEDNTFYRNKGVSFKSLIRGFFSRFKYFRKKYNFIENGGSTITMQLVRTLFIPTTQNKYLRKIAEILLSFWLNNQFTKDEILKLYVASVRYEKAVFGLADAIKHFFVKDLKNKELTDEEAFFLVERLSNISSTVNYDRMAHLIARTKTKIDTNKLKQIYDIQIQKGQLKG